MNKNPKKFKLKTLNQISLFVLILSMISILIKIYFYLDDFKGYITPIIKESSEKIEQKIEQKIGEFEVNKLEKEMSKIITKSSEKI